MLKNIASISWVDLIKIKPQMAQEPPLHLWLCWPLTDSWKFFFIIPWFAPAVFGRFWIRFLFSDPPKIVWRRDHPNYVTDRTLPLLQWASTAATLRYTCLLGRMQHLGLWSNEVAYPHGATGTYMMRDRWSSLRLQEASTVTLFIHDQPITTGSEWLLMYRMFTVTLFNRTFRELCFTTLTCVFSLELCYACLFVFHHINNTFFLLPVWWIQLNIHLTNSTTP